MSDQVSMSTQETSHRIANFPFLLVAVLVSAFLAFIALDTVSSGRVDWLLVGTAALGVASALFYLKTRSHQAKPAQNTLRFFRELQNRSAGKLLLTDTFGKRICGNSKLTDALPEMRESKDAVIYRVLESVRSNGQGAEVVAGKGGECISLFGSLLSEDHVLWTVVVDKAQKHQSTALGLASSFVQVICTEDGQVVDSNPHADAIFGHQPKNLAELIGSETVVSGGLYTLGNDQTKTVRASVQARGESEQEIIFSPVDFLETAGAGLDQLLDRMPVALARIQPDGTLIFANEPARGLLGDSAVSGVNLSNLIEGLGRSINERLEDVMRGRRHSRTEVARGMINEREIFLQVTLTRIVMNGEPALLVLLSDATELKTLEAQFVQSQKMQAVGQLAGGVAHDFNNLLTAINGHCDLLLLRQDSSDVGYSDLVQIQQNANRAASLVRQLLAFSRKQNLQPRVLDLKETLSDLTHLLNRLLGEKVTLEIDHGRELYPVRVDKRQFEQVVMNLVVNARDAIVDQGKVEVRTENRHLDEDLCRDRAVVPMGDYVVIEVVDSGSGIPDDKISQIFEPFFTTKAIGEGTGLGLSTAYGIIKQTGGFIFADSPAGAGAKFSIYLPAHDGVEPSPQDADVTIGDGTPRDFTGSGTVLLVEDEAPVRSFAARALTLRGYTVLEAASAEEALEMLKDADLHVDVFVSDVIMPGKDGPTWVREALKKRPDVKVVFVSGYAEDAFKDGQPEISGSIFLPKPFSLNELTEKVKEQISRKTLH